MPAPREIEGIDISVLDRPALNPGELYLDQARHLACGLAGEIESLDEQKALRQLAVTALDAAAGFRWLNDRLAAADSTANAAHAAELARLLTAEGARLTQASDQLATQRRQP